MKRQIQGASGIKLKNNGGCLWKERPDFLTTMRESWYCPLSEQHVHKLLDAVAFNLMPSLDDDGRSG